MAKGKAVYEKTCAACHQPEWQGFAARFPGAGRQQDRQWPAARHERQGHQGQPCRPCCNGKAGTAMQAFSTSLSDVELAAVITYERNSFGNQKGDMIQPAQIKSLR
jgi:cytochrome c oxidase subunit 2